MKNSLWFTLFAMFSLVTSADAASSKPPGKSEVRIRPVEPTPEPDNVNLRLLFPKDGEVKTSRPVNIEARVEGFALGVDSDFPRAGEIYDDGEGQSIHIFIDNEPYFAVNEAYLDSLDSHELYYTQSMDFDIPFALKDGMHVIRMFPARSFNESLKGDGCFVARTFYWKTREKMQGVDLSAPYLTYNEPQGDYDFDPKEPILLDFYLTNCELSSDGYKVRLSIDGTVEATLHNWVPYYVYGLKKGSHTFRLELLDPNGKRVSGLFNDTSRTIHLK